jgi:hypothetical protein
MSDSDSSFDPGQFLDATTQEALVKRPPLPAGQSFIGTITEMAVREWKSKKEDAKVKSGVAFDLKVEIDLQAYPEVQASLNMPKVVLTPGIMIDLKEDGKTIDWGMGRNGALRRWREALGMNNPGETFSPRQMIGRQILAKIKHRVYEGEFYDEIDSVAKA